MRFLGITLATRTPTRPNSVPVWYPTGPLRSLYAGVTKSTLQPGRVLGWRNPALHREIPPHLQHCDQAEPLGFRIAQVTAGTRCYTRLTGRNCSAKRSIGTAYIHVTRQLLRKRRYSDVTIPRNRLPSQ